MENKNILKSSANPINISLNLEINEIFRNKVEVQFNIKKEKIPFLEFYSF